jgi:hypothetical protein
VLDPPSPTVSSAPGDALAPPLGPHRLPWAALLARVFALDVTVCPACGGRLRLIAALTDPASVRRICKGSACRPSRRRLSHLEPHPSKSGTSPHNPILDTTSLVVEYTPNTHIGLIFTMRFKSMETLWRPKLLERNKGLRHIDVTPCFYSWYRRGDSNPHASKGTAPSRQRVYQFHHFGMQIQDITL